MFPTIEDCFFGYEIETLSTNGDAGVNRMQEIKNALVGMGLQCRVVNYTFSDYQPAVWLLKTDASLGSMGVEVISPTMTCTPASFDEVKQVMDWLRTHSFDSGNSRCGGHAHISVAPRFNVTSREYAAVSLRYAARKSEMDAILPPSRRLNQYANPLAGSALTKVEQATVGAALSFGHGERFTAVNLEHIGKGINSRRVEFRAAGGTLQPSKAAGYIKLYAAFVCATVKMMRESNVAPAAPVAARVVELPEPTTNVFAEVAEPSRTRRPRGHRRLRPDGFPYYERSERVMHFEQELLRIGIVTATFAAAQGWTYEQLRACRDIMRRNGADIVRLDQNDGIAFSVRNRSFLPTSREQMYPVPGQRAPSSRRAANALPPTTGSARAAQPNVQTHPAAPASPARLLGLLRAAPLLQDAPEDIVSWYAGRREDFSA